MEDKEMKTYKLIVTVEYVYEVEAESAEEAEEMGWNYEEYAYDAEVYSIRVDEIEEEEEEEEEKD